jgi:peroxiredoxin
MPITPLMPREPVPSLELPTVDGGNWSLAAQKPENFTLIVFYRGRHCPICSMYLGDLNSKADQFAEKGVSIFVASTDGEERAADAKAEWKLDKLTVGHSLSLDDARDWGLYISAGRGLTSIGIEEPALFNEPGVFLVRPDGTLYYAAVQSMPFARPNFGDLLKAVDFALAKNYPARGEIADHKQVAAE